MLARMAGTVVLAVIVFVVASLLVGFGVLWWSGSPTFSATVGAISGLAAAFLIGAASIAVGRSPQRSREHSDRRGSGPDR